MARLIALVLLRWRLELRAYAGARERAFGLVLMVPSLLLFSAFGSAVAFFGARGLSRTDPEALLPLLSAIATAIGLFWALSPLLTGVALSESHDMTRLLHFPIPLPTLVASSLIANLAQPTVLAELPMLGFLALGLAGISPAFPLALFGVLLSLATMLAFAQTVGLALHGLSRHRRLHDVAVSLAIVFGFLTSLVPLLILTHAPVLGHVARALVGADVFALSPFAWGVRAAVHAGRGEGLAFAAHTTLGVSSVVLAMAASAGLMHRIYRGELRLAGAARTSGAARMFFAGPIGALVEKDLRSAWRDPALRTALLLGLVGPLFFLFLLSQTAMDLRAGTTLLLLASLVGMGTYGGTALGFERRGVGLLLGFPVPRWRILAAKNLVAVAFRLPGLVTLAAATLVLAPMRLAPAVATIAAITLALCAGVDNYLSVLFPVASPAPGRNPYGGASAGGRGLGAALLSSLLLMVALLLSSPFVLLAWLPLLLGRPGLWLISLPLALAGAGAIYAMLVAHAASLFARREPEILARILGEE